MPLVLCPASRSDAEKIASIHMTAFESNVMLHAQFPTPAAREGLQRSVKAKAIADIDDARTTVLVVRDLSEAEQRRQSKDGYLEQGVDERKEGGVEGQVIAFAKWSHPVPEDEEYSEPEWVWKEEANLKMIDKWTKRTEEAQENAVGRTPCYRKFRGGRCLAILCSRLHAELHTFQVLVSLARIQYTKEEVQDRYCFSGVRRDVERSTSRDT
ncbi:hypothetical protein MMC10_006092 [Thelotrema lepadinum]|nr:hypothetical protein [Thelotrema lepadinum]